MRQYEKTGGWGITIDEYQDRKSNDVMILHARRVDNMNSSNHSLDLLKTQCRLITKQRSRHELLSWPIPLTYERSSTYLFNFV